MHTSFHGEIDSAGGGGNSDTTTLAIAGGGKGEGEGDAGGSNGVFEDRLEGHHGCFVIGMCK